MNSKKTTEKMLHEMTAVRHKRIQAIKRKIFRGRYKVDNSAIAKALFLAQ